jgi:hypothetical protein
VLNEYRIALHKKFKMTGGEATMHYGLDIKRDQSTGTVGLGAATYTGNAINKFDIDTSTEVYTPMASDLALDKLPGTCPDKATNTRYRSIVGSLVFPAPTCRPDIAHACHVISRHLNHPGPEHLISAERVLAYLFTLHHTRHEYATYGVGGEIEYYGTADAAQMTVSHSPEWPPTKGVSGMHFQRIRRPAVMARMHTAAHIALIDCESERESYTRWTKLRERTSTC